MAASAQMYIKRLGQMDTYEHLSTIRPKDTPPQFARHRCKNQVNASASHYLAPMHPCVMRCYLMKQLSVDFRVLDVVLEVGHPAMRTCLYSQDLKMLNFCYQSLDSFTFFS